MSLPDRAIVVADTREELAELMLFFDIRNICWPSGRTCCSVIDIIWNNKNIKEYGDNVAINIRDGFPKGYCWPGYYRIRHKQYCNADPKWNFISVEDFIKEVGGTPLRLDVNDLL